MNSMTVGDYASLEEAVRPPAKYRGYPVQGVYRDPSYKEIERYVVRFDGIGHGSIKPETQLEIPDRPATTPKVVEHIGRQWVAVLSSYENKRPALILVPLDPELRSDRTEALVASVNLVDIFLDSGMIHIKTWSASHEGIVEHLAAAGLIEVTSRTAKAGYAFAAVCNLTINEGDTIPTPW